MSHAALEHVPPKQNGAPPGQVLPQAPQLSLLLDSSTHWPPQFVSPGRHAQVPETHASAAGQLVAQVPQCLGSRERSRQVLPPPQGTRLVAPQPHTPDVHVPNTGSQAFPHAPQLPRLVVGLMQPTPGQLIWPGIAH